MRVRDEEKAEFFLCSEFECAEWAEPAEQQDISADDWEPFVFPRPPTKAPRLEAIEEEDFEAGDDGQEEGWEEYNEEHDEDENWEDAENGNEDADDDAEEV